jgi:hypothetical protein
MGWARGVNYKGREVGYATRTTCEEPNCEEKINCGLAYCCGDLEGAMGEHGCGGYFCYAHLFYGEWEGQRCLACAESEFKSMET